MFQVAQLGHRRHIKMADTMRRHKNLRFADVSQPANSKRKRRRWRRDRRVATSHRKHVVVIGVAEYFDDALVSAASVARLFIGPRRAKF